MHQESCDWYFWDSTGEPGQSEVLSSQNQVFIPRWIKTSSRHHVRWGGEPSGSCRDGWSSGNAYQPWWPTGLSITSLSRICFSRLLRFGQKSNAGKVLGISKWWRQLCSGKPSERWKLCFLPMVIPSVYYALREALLTLWLRVCTGICDVKRINRWTPIKMFLLNLRNF